MLLIRNCFKYSGCYKIGKILKNTEIESNRRLKITIKEAQLFLIWSTHNQINIHHKSTKKPIKQDEC